MKKLLTSIAIAITVSLPAMAQGIDFNQLLSTYGTDRNAERVAALQGYAIGYRFGADTRHAENTAKVHRFAGAAYERATGIALYGGVGRASRNLAAALDAKVAQINALNATIAGEAGRTQAAIDAAKARATARLSYGVINATRTLEIAEMVDGTVNGVIGQMNLGVSRYDNSVPAGYSIDTIEVEDLASRDGTLVESAPISTNVLNAIANGTITTYTIPRNSGTFIAGSDTGLSQLTDVNVNDVISGVLENVYQDGYDNGYKDGYVDGYAEGFNDGIASVR